MIKLTKYNNSIKETIVSLILILFFFSIFSFTKQKEQNPFKKINIKYNLPFLKNNGDIGNLADSLSIIYSGNNIIYEIPHYLSVEKNDSIVSTKTTFKYFAYQKGAEEGFWFDSINAVSKKKENIFTVHKEKTFLTPPDLFDEKNDVLIDTNRNKDGYTLIETYVSKIKKDITYSDTMKVYYKNELKNIDYSISKKLDSIKKLKVFKIRLIYNSKAIKEYPYKLSKRELNVSIQEDTISNLSKYDNFINAFQNKNN
jgi:hypothetical protein